LDQKYPWHLLDPWHPFFQLDLLNPYHQYLLGFLVDPQYQEVLMRHPDLGHQYLPEFQ
jgi:hypothetical protein